MNIIITLTIVYLLSFSLILAIAYFLNKKESEEEKDSIMTLVIVSLLLALPVTVMIGIILLVILGSLNAVDMIFSLDVKMNQLILFAIFILIYLFTIDSMVEKITEYLVGEKVLYFVIMILARTFAFYLIGLIIGINQTNSLVIAAGATIIIVILEVLYHKSKKEK